jgi:5-methylcytosine-specific restriction endonuclease McrA
VLANSPVLVLNQSYEPLNICHAKRALALIMAGRAEMLENGRGYIHTPATAYAVPSVIKLDYIIRRPRAERKLTRIAVFHRDNFTCQYCGKESQLTIDHVIPRFQGGKHTWENVVAACVPCNRHKAGRTPEQANMKLRSTPDKPKDYYAFYLPHRYIEHLDQWGKYLPQYFTT